MVGLGRVELPTSRLSGVRSNHLSYRPAYRISVAAFRKSKETRTVTQCALVFVFRKPRSDTGAKHGHPNERGILRKEVIQPQVPLRLPCYDLTPVAGLTVAGCLLAVSSPSSGNPNSHGLTGGVYKARERIHRSMLFCDY